MERSVMLLSLEAAQIKAALRKPPSHDAGRAQVSGSLTGVFAHAPSAKSPDGVNVNPRQSRANRHLEHVAQILDLTDSQKGAGPGDSPGCWGLR